MVTKPGHEIFEEIGASMAAGTATPQEQEMLLAHLSTCADCTVICKAFSEVAAILPQALPPMQPPPSVRANLLEAIAREKGIAPGVPLTFPRPELAFLKRFAWAWPLGWAFAGIFGIILAWTAQIMQQTTASHQAAVQALQLTLAEKEELLALMEARQSLLVSLTGSSALPNALGRVIWNPETNTGLMIALNLPPAPTGKVYQLWAIQGGAPVDAGIFAPSRETELFKTKPLPNPKEAISLFAITMEPAGGSPGPTSDIILKGEVSSSS